jgi:hypothetical protein
MNDLKTSIESTSLIINPAQSIIILLPSGPGQDHLRSAICLADSLSQAGKTVQIGASNVVNTDDLPGIDQVKDSIGSRNLKISFDYQEEYLEQVDYDITADGKFVLLVKPKLDAPVPDTNQVKFEYSGAEADLIIFIGVNQKEDLGKIYAEEKQFVDNTKILSLSISQAPLAFEADKLHLVLSSLSELVATYISQSQASITKDMASSLITGIYQGSKNLTSGTINSYTFSTLSYLMENGGKLPNQTSFVTGLNTPTFFDTPSPDNTPPADWKSPKIFRSGPLPAMNQPINN